MHFLGYTQAPPAYAAAGGSVVPASIDEAAFEDNSFTGLSVAVLILAESETIRFSANNVSQGGAGLWLLSPLEANLLLQDSLATSASLDFSILSGASVAMSYPLPQGDPTAPGPVPAASAAVFIHAGEKGANLVDSQGNTWTADTGLSAVIIGGDSSKLASMDAEITKTLPSTAAQDQALYKSFRYGSSFTYTFQSLTPGYYTVTLKFADIGAEIAREILKALGTDTKSWTFDVCINSQYISTVTVNLLVDKPAAQDLVLTNIPAVNGQIKIQFAGQASTKSEAMVSAVELNPQWSQSVSNPGGSWTGLSEFLRAAGGAKRTRVCRPCAREFAHHRQRNARIVFGGCLNPGGGSGPKRKRQFAHADREPIGERNSGRPQLRGTHGDDGRSGGTTGRSRRLFSRHGPRSCRSADA